MEKTKLLRYINNESSDSEKEEVESWILSSNENLLYYSNLKNLELASYMSKESYASDEDFNRFIQQTNLFKRHRRIPNIFYKVAGVAIIVISFILNIYFFAQKPTDTPIAKVYSNVGGNNQTCSYYTPRGVKGHIFLPDGSEVWLNSDSRIEFPYKFSNTNRDVLLIGEGYFKVKSDSIVPMIVRTEKDFFVKVKGTEFNLSCYENDETATAELYKGSIEIIDIKNKTFKKLQPNQYYIKENEENSSRIEVKQVKDSLWKEGFLIFTATDMNEVIKKLSRWYGAEFIVKDKKVLANKINANFNGESLQQIMELISLCSDIDYKIKGKEIILSSKN
jgi:transmembrane sensor